MRNRERDSEVIDALRDAGWRCLTVWECAMRGPGRLESEVLLDRIAAWLEAGKDTTHVRGE